MSVMDQLKGIGQSLWLDLIRREMLTNGEQQKLIAQGVKGQTSNPAIFEKAMAEGHHYDAEMKELSSRVDLDVKGAYEQMAITDIRSAADLFRALYESTDAGDGYVSLEVSPYLAFDTQGTIDEGRRLWNAVERPNLMIKVPGTPAGIPAIEQLISEGINVNVTLLFARDMYEAAAEAYVRGIERRAKQGLPIDRVASVASFFVSRIDTLADKLLAEVAEKSGGAERVAAEGLQGKVAIANAKLAYRWFQELCRGDRWTALAAEGARPQRLLWASTSTKNPRYRDVIYVEELLGPDTVNTLPLATFQAFLDHGRVRPSLTENVDEAARQLERLEALGISLRAVTDKVLAEAVTLFCDPFDKLLGSLERKRQQLLGNRLNAQELKIAMNLQHEIADTVEAWRASGKGRRLWQKDSSLWTGGDEAKWLGWLNLVPEGRQRIADFESLRHEVESAGLCDVVLLGMGGSSLAPEVLQTLFDPGEKFPGFHVLDSTDPTQIRALESKLDLRKSAFIVASKSGSTLEPTLFFEYFYSRMVQAIGPDKAGAHFFAVTDPGSALEKEAKAKGFRRIFHGVPSVGGRYSALSAFGLVPAAVMGIDVSALLDSAQRMVSACGEFVPPAENPGVTLGIVLGTLAKLKRDKLTVLTSPEIWDLGSWLEQLVAESTGKAGKAIIPVVEEEVGAPSVYGKDRVFVYLKLEGSIDQELDARVEELRRADHPVIVIHIQGPISIGQEFFRWEIATAVAGSVLGIHPFDQPDVEASKIATKKLAAELEKTGSLPKEIPLVQTPALSLYADDENSRALRGAANGGSAERYLQEHLNRLGPGDYFALLAYVEMSLSNEILIQEIRQLVRDAKCVATCVGFGPRFLHSTGQAYKGGPNTGVFLQITCDEANDLAVPGRKLSFGQVKAAQALGDFQVLAERHRRALRVHLGKDVGAGLLQLKQLVAGALAAQSGDGVHVAASGQAREGRASR